MHPSLKVVLFLIASAGIFRVSYASLRNFHLHGFYRFFAWEAALALLLLNIDQVVYGASNIPQTIAYLCLGISLLLAAHGFVVLRKVGKPDTKRTDPALLWVEKTTVLVTVGAYKYIRHPLYCSFLFLTWSVFFLLPSWRGFGLAFTATFSLVLAARMEEIENLRYFGAAYAVYMKQTKRFIPFVL
jgi:protein-S-isoprenylcysteine O-methyltransferase Ste14